MNTLLLFCLKTSIGEWRISEFIFSVFLLLCYSWSSILLPSKRRHCMDYVYGVLLWSGFVQRSAFVSFAFVLLAVNVITVVFGIVLGSLVRIGQVLMSRFSFTLLFFVVASFALFHCCLRWFLLFCEVDLPESGMRYFFFVVGVLL